MEAVHVNATKRRKLKMSTMQELIARNASQAYQQGISRGAAQERERILKILTNQASHLTTEGLIRLIAKAQK